MPLILSPKLKSRLLKRQNEHVYFFIWTDISPLSSIELWSNLNQHKTWHSTSFTSIMNDEHNEGWYQLTIPLLQPCGTYEYTLRYWQNGQLVWLGSEFENGIITITASTNPLALSPPPPPPLDLSDTGHFITLLNSHQPNFWIYKIEKRIGKNWVSLLTMNRIHSYMALARKSSCWLVPVSGMGLVEHDARPWQLFIYRDILDGSTTAWMVRTCKNQDGWLHVNTTTSTSALELHTVAEKDEQDEDKENTMYLVGGTTHGTSDNAIKTLISTILASSTKQQQQHNQSNGLSSVMNDYLGYCTWNSLGQQDMNMAGINKALDSFERHGIPIGYLIMDDGWQEHRDGYLTSFDADLLKFPGGLCETIRSLKQRYTSLRSIGVWHALWGYWRGVDVASIGKLYSPWRSYCFWGSEGNTRIFYQILFDRVDRFYDDFYRHLTKAGVDMVKIDYQGGIGDLMWNDNKMPLTLKNRHQLWSVYCTAAAHALEKYFATPPLHCMALNPYLLDGCALTMEKNANTWYGGIIRNSDDFFPDVADSHPWHIYGNLLNSMWSSSSFSMIDFDMFQSGHPFGEYHATSRAISGGPIYITDIPGHHNTQLIKTLTAENREGLHQILRSSQACWPLYDTVLGGNPVVNQDYIGAWNTVGNFGFIYGYWSMRMGNHQCIVTTPIPFGYVGYVSLGLDTGKWIYNLESKDDLLLAFRLADGGCSLIRVVPAHLLQHDMTGTISCLGLLDKLNGLQPISHVEIDSSTSIQSLCLERSNQIDHQRTYVFRIQLSHRSSQCGFLLSWPVNTSTPEAKIIWTRMDGRNVNLEKTMQIHRFSTPPTQQTAALWILDMTQVPLSASNNFYFSIDICISF